MNAGQKVDIGEDGEGEDRGEEKKKKKKGGKPKRYLSGLLDNFYVLIPWEECRRRRLHRHRVREETADEKRTCAYLVLVVDRSSRRRS